MTINKVQIGDEEVLIDLSSDTAEEMAVDDGVQFHDSNGEVNKVDVNGITVLDLTKDDVIEDTVDEGVQFHSSDGVIRIGRRKIDDEMSDTSTNAPQNKVVKKYVDDGLANKSDIGHTHSASDIVSGILSSDRIPTITNSKIESMDASKLTGTVPSEVLPSYVDDVIEGYYYNDKFYKDSAHTASITGETGKIYVSLDNNKTYRYSGSIYVVISETLALGETSSTAYRGDRGKIAYDHANVKGVAVSSVLGKVTTNTEGHVTGITPIVKADITGLGIPSQDTTYDVATQSKAGLESASDKTKLDGIAEGANKYVLPNATTSILGGIKVGSNLTISEGVLSLSKANVVGALGYTPPTTNTTYSAATSSTLGLVKIGSNISNSNGTISLSYDNVKNALGYTPISSDEVYGNFALGSWVSNTFGTIEWINTIADVANNTAWSLPTVQNTANEALNRAKGLIQNSNPVSDLNNYVNGVGLFNTKNCVNLPAGSYTTSEFYMVISACVDADTGIQIAYEIIGDKTSHKKVWFRTLAQKTWLPWVRE